MEVRKPIEVGDRYSIAGVEHEVSAIHEGSIMFSAIKYDRRFLVPLDEVLVKIQRGVYRLIQAAPATFTSAALYLSLNEKQKAKLERQIKYVNALLEEFSGRLPKTATLEFVADYANKIKDANPPGYTTLTKWMKLFRESGGNPLSLIPKDWNRKPSGKKLDPAIKNLIKHYIESRFLTEERATVESVKNAIYAHIAQDNANKPAAEQLKPPGRATIYRYVDRLDPYLRDYARLGAHQARKKHKYGRKNRKPARLLERVEMDSHCIDLIIVDEYGATLGRAWMCIAIEVLTGVVQACEISFTPPCAEKTLRVLKQCLSSNNPYGGKAENYYVDNGAEFQNSPVINLLNLYNSKITFVPPKSPDQKPIVERFFGTLNTQLIHHMPGTTRSNPVDRGDYDSEKRACITLPKLKAYFAEWLETVYHVAPHGERYISPNHAWNKKALEDFPPERYAEDELNLVCRAFVSRKITGGRVEFDRLSWYGPGLTTLEEKLGPIKARVYYDPTDLGTVYVADPRNPNHMVQADATNPEYQNGLTLYEHKLAKKELAESACQFSIAAATSALAHIHERIAAESDTGAKPKKAKTSKPMTKVDPTIMTDAQIRKSNFELTKLEQSYLATPTIADEIDDFDSFSLDN